MSSLGVARLAAGGAALVLAVSSSGDAVVLAALLALAACRPLAGLAAFGALVAVAWRWGSSSLEAIAGAQAVLGPGGLVEPGSAAVSSCAAALALVLAATRPLPRSAPGAATLGSGPLGALLLAGAAGAAAAVATAGPAPGGALWLRAVVTSTGVAVALGLSVLRARGAAVGLVLDGAAVVLAGGALVLASVDAPTWSGTFTGDQLAEGLAVGAAGGALAIAVAALLVLRPPAAAR